jgi:anti-anti-sigma regulatory factor
MSELATELILDETADKETSSTIVLQPKQNLAGQTGIAFQKNLMGAIAQADAVIVDLLWVKEIDQAAMTVLLVGMKQANRLGKSLSFLSMQAGVRSQIEKIWQQQHETQISAQSEAFAPEFERFLEQHQKPPVRTNGNSSR